jgi:Flp pilus assembly pilin Flp
MEFIKRFIGEDSGITAAEYGIILGTIAGVLVVGIIFFFQEMGNLFSSFGSMFAGGTPP